MKMDRQTLKAVIIDQNQIMIPDHYYKREAFASIKKLSLPIKSVQNGQ